MITIFKKLFVSWTFLFVVKLTVKQFRGIDLLLIINLSGHKITVRPLFGQNKERTQLWQWWQWTIHLIIFLNFENIKYY